MPIDSTNYGREIKNLRADISDLRTEVAFMYSAFQNIQEQFGFALAEIANSIKTLNGEIKNFQQNNSVADSVNENFSRIEKISETQQLNFRNYFDKIESSLAAQQKIFSDIFNQQSAEFEKNFNSMQEKISGVGENISVVQKNIKKFSSEVDEILSDNQKNLLKKIDSANDKPKDFYKTLNAIEELLRLIAANQLLNQVQQNLPTKNNSLPKVSAKKKKHIFICGQIKTGKTTLAEVLKFRLDNLEIVETSIDLSEVSGKINADLIIFVLDEKVCTYRVMQRFYDLLVNNRQILVVVNPTENKNDKNIFENFKDAIRKYFPTLPSDWDRVFVVNVYLKGAREAWSKGDYGKFHRSNFEAIEKFINEL